MGLDLSFDPRTFLVTTKGESAIAIAWSVRKAPDYVPGPVPTSLSLYNISPDTLASLRTFNNQLFSLTGGKVYATQLDFDGRRLVVQGTKDGVLLGGFPESGSGPHFTATFERFLDGEASATVVAY